MPAYAVDAGNPKAISKAKSIFLISKHPLTDACVLLDVPAEAVRGWDAAKADALHIPVL